LWNGVVNLNRAHWNLYDMAQSNRHTYEPGCSGKRCEHETAAADAEFDTATTLRSAT